MSLPVINNSGKSRYFAEFASSDVIQNIISNASKAANLDITVTDFLGNILVEPDFFNRSRYEIREQFVSLLKGEIAELNVKCRARTLRFKDEKEASFIVSPICISENEMAVGYLLGGPGRFVSSDSDLIVDSDSYYRVANYANGFAPDSVFEGDLKAMVLSTMGSYGHMLGLLFDEKLRSSRNFDRLKGLSQVGTSLTGTIDLERVLQLVLDRAIELLEAIDGSLLLLDDEKQELRIFVAHGLSEDIVKKTRIKVGESIAGIVAKEGRPKILIKGIRVSTGGERDEEKLPAAMSVPLKAKEKVIGVLNISGRNDERDFDQDDLELLMALAANAAAAIENARLYTEIQGKLKEHQALFDLGMTLVSTHESKNVLEKVLENAITLLHARDGSLMILDPIKEILEIEVAHGLPEDVVKNTRIRLGEGISGGVARDGEPRLLKKGKKEVDSASGEAKEYPTALCVPMKFQGKIVGVINVKEKTTGENFDESDLKLLSMLASNAAVAIQNSNLYNQLQGKIRELNALFDLGTTMVSSLDRRQVMEEVLNNAIGLLHAKDGSLMIINQDSGELEIDVAHGLPEEVVNNTRIKIGEGIAGKVAAEGIPRLLLKGIKESESKSGDAKVFPTAMSVPMKFRDKMIGVINVKEKTTGENFSQTDLELLTMLASLAAVAIENAELHKSLQDLFVNSIQALANAIDARDPYTAGHSERVTEYSVKIGEYMGMEKDELQKLRYAALLHDIGKINIKEEILNKPGRLTEEEFQIMHMHPTLGAKIMEPVKEFSDILPIMYHHHERYGAGGYPDGVFGEAIPLAARILAVADSFDAMTTNRPYRTALPIEVALSELKKHVGTQFDPKVVNVFLTICDEEREWVDDMIESSKLINT